MRINNIVLYKPAQIGETPETGNTEGKACVLIYKYGILQKRGGEYMKDLSGMKFGKRTVLERAYDKNKSKGARWLCQCECGVQRVVFGRNLRNGASKSCGCSNNRNFVGKRFGNLVVMSVEKNGDNTICHCLCDCGNTVDIVGKSIYSTRSCGCSRRTNRVGERYGKLVIDKMLYNLKGDNITYVSCTCDCGNAGYITRLNALRTGGTQSCGCVHNPDLTGKRFGRLTVIKQVNSDTSQRRWLCKCDCGSTTEAISYWLTSGHVKSCGCLRSDKNSNAEVFIRHFLDTINIPYISEHTFPDCVGVKGWKLRFDFYLPTQNMAIEFDGKQHYCPVQFWGGKEKYELQKQNDMIKNEYCINNGILLLRLPYTETYEEIMKIIAIYINIQESRNDHSIGGNDYAYAG